METAVEALRALAAPAETSASSESTDAWLRIVEHVRDRPSLLNEPGIAYIAGYAYYQLVESLPNAASRAAELLRTAALEQPSDPYAKLYLGHLAFDSGEYERALKWFDAIPERSFAAFHQEWRDLKRQELRICCLVQLCSTAELTHEFKCLIELATTCQPSDSLTVSELPRLVASLVSATRHVA